MLIEYISPTLNNKHNSDWQKIKTQTASNTLFMNITEDTIISTVKCIYSMYLLQWATHLKLDDPLLRKAQVHPLRILQVKGTLMQLGDGVICIQQGGLLIHLTDDLCVCVCVREEDR